jgi:tetratricopeptide (TPR) repeat protein
LQGEISRAIAEEVRLTLSTRESQRLTPTRAVKPEAYDAYLLGRHHWDQRSPESLERALAYFQSAVDKDPDFAQAHAGLALALGPQAIFGYTPPGQGLAKQKSAALRALELDPTLAEARTALAAFHAREWNWTEAEEEYRRAVEIDPNSAVGHVRYGWYLHALGRFAESLAHRKRALELDPLNVAVNRGLARDLEATGDPEKAAAQWQRVLELEPAQVPHHLSLSLLQFELGHTDEALRSLERARAMGPFDPPSLAHLAVVEAASGNAPEARRRLLQLRAESGRYVSPVLVALVHASLGETDETFALLEKAYTAKDPLLIRIQVGEAGLSLRLPKRQLAALRSDPRFSDLVRRMGLPPLTPAAGSH